MNNINLYATQEKSTFFPYDFFQEKLNNMSSSKGLHWISQAINRMCPPPNPPLFTNNFLSLSQWVTPYWITHKWKCIWKQLVLEENKNDLQNQRQNYYYIMEDFIKSGMWEGDISDTNRCQKFLHTTWLSEILTRDRTGIPPSLWRGRKN